ncbi:hypothetical protein S40288_10066 [Stachybotrys chartarum IBT 40288]|nr:hypothetical protein S40288_10066 [Stachybotrys chartarum IBT 40288]
MKLVFLAAMRHMSTWSSKSPCQDVRGETMPAAVKPQSISYICHLALFLGFDNTNIRDGIDRATVAEESSRTEFAPKSGLFTDWRAGIPFTKTYLYIQKTIGFFHQFGCAQPHGTAFVPQDFMVAFFGDMEDLTVDMSQSDHMLPVSPSPRQTERSPAPNSPTSSSNRGGVARDSAQPASQASLANSTQAEPLSRDRFPMASPQELQADQRLSTCRSPPPLSDYHSEERRLSTTSSAIARNSTVYPSRILTSVVASRDGRSPPRSEAHLSPTRRDGRSPPSGSIYTPLGSPISRIRRPHARASSARSSSLPIGVLREFSRATSTEPSSSRGSWHPRSPVRQPPMATPRQSIAVSPIRSMQPSRGRSVTPNPKRHAIYFPGGVQSTFPDTTNRSE